MRLMSDLILTIENGHHTTTITPEQLARTSMADGINGYLNLLSLTNPRQDKRLLLFDWGQNTLAIIGQVSNSTTLFELSSHDIILFKKHPGAISARNLLECTVKEIFDGGGRVGVVLAIGTETLVAEIVCQAAHELEVSVGTKLYAAIKASSFRQLV
jgi:molybdate transport system ATP-binding protein